MKGVRFGNFLQMLALFCFLCSTGMCHSIHISYGKARLGRNAFSGRIIFYKDDFFRALESWNGGTLQHLNDRQFDSLKLSYWQSHLSAVANDTSKLSLTISGNNEDASSIWFDFAFSDPKEIVVLKVKYTALFKEFSGQMNLLNVETRAGEKSLIFSSSSPQLKITL
ncbi:MAG: hypothetical protein KGJ59_10090 [Bacteroidota bacterium]|nr:hypothetical protein [Bacteroidota bacterium]